MNTVYDVSNVGLVYRGPASGSTGRASYAGARPACHSTVVLKSPTRALIDGVITTVLYGHLYILLKNKDYALLIGSIGLFVVIATIMYLTRKVNFSAQT